MEKKMFCFQCEQTAGCTGCIGSAGVCGKDATVAALQDQLTGAMIALANTCKGCPNEPDSSRSGERSLVATAQPRTAATAFPIACPAQP